MAHGAKEQLYHPQFYKTSPCSQPNCKRGSLCAFMHGPEDARQMEEQKQQQRDPIPGVAALLEKHQPSYWNPPRYHALEDPPRGISFGFGFGPGKGRPQGGKGGQLCSPFPTQGGKGQQMYLTNKRKNNRRGMRYPGMHKDIAAAQDPTAGMGMIAGDESPHLGLNLPNAAPQDGDSPYSLQNMQFAQPPPQVYWMPCPEGGPNMGGQQIVSYQLGESPSYSWNNGGRENTVWMPVMAMPPYMMSQSQQHLNPFAMNQNPVPLDQCHSQLVDKILDQLADKPKERRRGNSKAAYLQSDGLRTPSSYLGTPVATATPSEAPTPHSSSPRAKNGSDASSASASHPAEYAKVGDSCSSAVSID
jgi:hypothetical protein